MGITKIQIALAISISVLIISIVILAYIDYQEVDEGPPHGGEYTLEGFMFSLYPYKFLFLTEDDPELNLSLREELNKSVFEVVIEIEGQSPHLNKTYVYQFRNHDDFLSTPGNDDRLLLFEDWEYDVDYRFNIRFLCHSQNETVKSLSIFDEERYTGGSFRVTRVGKSNVVSYFDEDMNDVTEPGDNWVVYFGDITIYRIPALDTFSILITEYGEYESS